MTTLWSAWCRTWTCRCFKALQFHEVIDSIRGLKRVDLLVAGAVWNEPHLYARLDPMLRARSSGYLGSSAVGASFHHRRSALAGINSNLIDVSYIRYNTAHTGASMDTLPFLRPTGLVWCTTSRAFSRR